MTQSWFFYNKKTAFHNILIPNNNKTFKLARGINLTIKNEVYPVLSQM